MPRRELKSPSQVEEWLVAWGTLLPEPGTMVLIGSAALLWHAGQRGIEASLPESSMDVDPVTDSPKIAALCYDAVIGSDFEKTHGWHVNLMPAHVLNELPPDWRTRAVTRTYRQLTVDVPAPQDLVVPKLKRGEPRDLAHVEWARQLGLLLPQESPP